MPEDLLLLAAAALVNALAFFFQRITGFGSAIIATPLMALFWRPHYAINLLLVYQWVFGLSLIWITWRSLVDRRVLWFMAAFLPCTIAGAFLLPVLSEELVRNALAVVTVLVLLQWLLVPHFILKPKWIIPAAIIAGIGSGIVQGAFGMGGPFFLAYIGAVVKRSRVIRDATIAVFFVGNLLRVPVALGTAQFTPPVLWAAALAAVPFVLAMYLGGRLTERISDGFFRYALIGILAFAAINLILT
jgi:uncharacterized protein